MNTAVKIDIDILNKAFDYLARRPYFEVADLIAGLHNSIAKNQKAEGAPLPQPGEQRDANSN